jgi:hypothetical protein
MRLRGGARQIAITSIIAGELIQRRLMDGVRDVCGEALVTIPTDRISLNQAVRSLVGYFERHARVDLRWDLMISEPPFDTPAAGLRLWLTKYSRALNEGRAQDPPLTKERWTASVATVERDFWRDHLGVYGEVFAEHYQGPERTFDRFFDTDYFLDLPFVALKAYYLGDILGQRAIRPQDVADVYSLAELLPYTALYLMDTDQHHRLKTLSRRYPTLFANLEALTMVRSHLMSSENPMRALRSALDALAS